MTTYFNTPITQNQFEIAINAALGSIDYEFLLLAVSDYHFRRAKELRAEGMENAFDREFKKGEKILDYVCMYQKLNEEVAHEVHSIA